MFRVADRISKVFLRDLRLGVEVGVSGGFGAFEDDMVDERRQEIWDTPYGFFWDDGYGGDQKFDIFSSRRLELSRKMPATDRDDHKKAML